MSPPNLPAELWREILRLSVYIPGLLETKCDSPQDPLLWQGWEHRGTSHYRSTLETKLSIVQVSKTWREIGMEFLFEHLFLLGDIDSEFQRLSLIASIFERHSQSNGRSPSQSIKRLDIATSALTPTRLPTLMRLLTCCHNLRILTITSFGTAKVVCDADDLYNLASLLQSRFLHSLRRMAFNFADIRPPRDASLFRYHDLLPNVPLDTLELCCNLYSAQEQPSAITTVSSLTINHTKLKGQMIFWHFPALRHLSLCISDDDIRLYLPFITSHGPQLISLNFPSHDLVRGLALLVAPAINLRHLEFSIWNAESFAGNTFFPSITHIGLRTGCLWKWSDPSWTIPSTIFPNVQCIRWLDISDRPDWLVDMAQKNPNIRVEDKECRLIL